MVEKVYKLPRARYLGLSSHDCESHHECPICGRKFGSWSIEKFEKVNGYEICKCPSCGNTIRI